MRAFLRASWIFGLTEGIEISLVVLDGLEDERAELETHAVEINVGFLPHLVLEELLLAIEFFHGEGADDAPQMTGDGLLDGRLNAIDRHPEEALGGAPNVVDVALDLDLRHRLDVDRDSLDGVDVTEVDLEGHHPQREHLVLFPRRPDKRPAAPDDAESFDLAFLGANLLPEQLASTENDERLVRPRLLVADPDHKVGKERQYRENDGGEHQDCRGHESTSTELQ